MCTHLPRDRSRLERLRMWWAYQRSFTLAERVDRAKESACLGLAARLPDRLRMWVAVKLHAEWMHRNPTRHPESASAFDLYKRP